MAKESIEKALAQVDNNRRGFLKGLLLGSAALAALPLITSTAVAQEGDTNGTAKKKKKKGTEGTADNK
jgi:orotate phosphoribosyltransferase